MSIIREYRVYCCHRANVVANLFFRPVLYLGYFPALQPAQQWHRRTLIRKQDWQNCPGIESNIKTLLKFLVQFKKKSNNLIIFVHKGGSVIGISSIHGICKHNFNIFRKTGMWEGLWYAMFSESIKGTQIV